MGSLAEAPGVEGALDVLEVQSGRQHFEDGQGPPSTLDNTSSLKQKLEKMTFPFKKISPL